MPGSVEYSARRENGDYDENFIKMLGLMPVARNHLSSDHDAFVVRVKDSKVLYWQLKLSP